MFQRFKWGSLIALMVTTVCVPRVNAQVDVQKGRHSFGVSGFSGDASIAGQVTDVLKNDIRLSGYFSLAPASSAEFVESGAVRGDRSGVVIECIVMQQATKKVVLSKTYQGSGQDLRRAVHKLTDDIVQAITGATGHCGDQDRVCLGARRREGIGRDGLRRLQRKTTHV